LLLVLAFGVISKKSFPNKYHEDLSNKVKEWIMLNVAVLFYIGRKDKASLMGRYLIRNLNE
jgi:hypothetical protein